ncbi:hypothetical protein ABI59_22830 [Acidobacteria bacterium Mor1]|nr:hypothetical protein ABI59_22830 [Acidobacteria bacterium Mor1]
MCWLLGFVAAGFLSLTGYYMNLFFYLPRGNDWLVELSVLLRTEKPLWFAFALCGVAAGLAIFLLVYGVFRRKAEGVTASSRRRSLRRAVERLGALSVGFGLNVLLFRIAPVPAFVTDGWDRAAPALLDWRDPERGAAWLGRSHHLEWFCGLGVLASLVVLGLGWSALQGDRRSRRQFLGLAVTMLFVSALVPWSGMLRVLPGSTYGDLVNGGIPEILVQGRFDGVAAEYVDRHHTTFDRSGARLPLGGYHQERFLEQHAEDRVVEGLRRCDAVVLPRAAYWDSRGLSIQLSSRAAAGPVGRILTVPRYADRWYVSDAGQPGRALPYGGKPLEQELTGVSRVILKADWMIPYDELREILVSLRQAGVDRVDLATVPLGFAPGPVNSLRWVESATAPTFQPTYRRSTPRVLMVKKYTPLEAFATVPATTCRVGGDGGQWLVFRWNLARRETLAPVQRLPEPQNYGELIALLERIRAGGAEAVVLPPTLENFLP